MNTQSILLIMLSVNLAVLFLLIFTIVKGVGFKMLMAYFTASFKRKKGYGIAWFFTMAGVPLYKIVDLTEKTFLIKTKKKEKLYNVNRECIVYTDTGVPLIFYPAGDADPFNVAEGLPTVTDPEVQQATLAKLNSADNALSPFTWFKENGFKIATLFLILIGIFGFIILNMTDQIAFLAQNAQTGAIVLQNGTVIRG